MPREKRFASAITPEDYLDYHFSRGGRKVVGFALNYRALLGGQWREVVRYDTDHGPLHVHRFWLPEERQVRYLEERPSADYRAALDEAERDLLARWEDYRRRMAGRLT